MRPLKLAALNVALVVLLLLRFVFHALDNLGRVIALRAILGR